MATIQEFDYAADLRAVLLWQYNQATNLQALVNNEQTFFDVNSKDFWFNWFDNVFNLYSPDFNAFGASVWSIILGLPLQIDASPDPAGKPIWGFDDSSFFNFDNGNFTNGDTSITLTLPEQILILKLRYFQLTTRGDVTSINAFLATVFNGFENYQGTAYVLDNLNMTMTYVFTAELSAGMISALTTFDLLPRPAAVGLNIVIDPASVFSFDNPQNFDNGIFIRGS